MNRLLLLGGSAGAREAAAAIVAALAHDLPAAVLVVLHLAPRAERGTRAWLARAAGRPVTVAADGEPLEAGRLYVAPSDQHTLVLDHALRVVRGPRVNRVRPAIDLAFRSAAVAHGAKVVGVVLSGMLDDGAAGLQAIARCGGTTVVQDPADAAFAEMPESALRAVQPHHTLPHGAIGPLLNRLAAAPPPPTTVPVPEDVALENRFDLDGADDLAEMNRLGRQVPFVCPDCSGPLWEVGEKGARHYRCHVGHALTTRSLLAAQDDAVDAALWVALRALEEKHRMQERLVRSERESGRTELADAFAERAAETREHADRLRALLSTLDGTPYAAGGAS